jgi:hypothetical protein
MLEYLEKFNNLPDDVKQKVSSGAVMAILEEMEATYGVNLANFVMRVMVGDLYYKNLTANLIIEYDLDPEVADKLAKELDDKVFSLVMDYLSGAKAKPAAKPTDISSPFFGPKATTENVAAKPNSGPVVRRAPVKAPAPVSFIEEDKSDIAAMDKITSALKNLPQERVNLLLGTIIREANIVFASENLLKRFKEILMSYLRGIRTKVEVRENLLKDVVSGGVKMSEAEADRVLNIAQKRMAVDEGKVFPVLNKVSAKSNSSGTSFIFNDNEIKQALAERNGKTLTQSVTGARDVEYDLSALRNRPAAVAPVPEKAVTAVSQPVPAKENLVTPPKIELPVAKPNIVSPKVVPVVSPVLPVIPVSSSKAAEEIPVKTVEVETKRVAAVVGNKKRMDDIKPAPRIMSPIDELAYMDLVNFRRLDPDPLKRVAKIEEKIALLEKEGIDKKIEGIRVWRLNPVNKTYIAIGQESIGSGKSIDDIIKERKDQGLNYLTQEEIEAVMDLNNNLRF